MRAIPAIDILGGKCVRLREGDYDSAHIFDDDPALVAQRFLQMGARHLHLIDLDAAKSGRPENMATVHAVLSAAQEYDAMVQVGGGLRSMDALREVLDAGAAFAIIGTAAVQSPDFREAAIAEFAGQIILAADVREGCVAVAGWCEQSSMHIDELLAAVRPTPPAAIVFTDIGCDGMMCGVNVEATAQVAAKAPCPVIASGGVRGADDLQALKAASDNISGAVIGRAVYEDITILQPLLARYG